MEFSSIWSVPLLGTVLALAVVAALLAMRAWPRPGLTRDERTEMAGAPMPVLQKRAWLGLLIGGGTLILIAVILMTRGGAAEYWDNDSLRLTVMLIFIVGLASHAGILLAPVVRAELGGGGQVDERDKAVLSRAGTIQSGVVLVTLAAWLLFLTNKFHDQGAVPVVYLYLLFGAIIMFHMIGQSIGILFGYWYVARHGEG